MKWLPLIMAALFVVSDRGASRSAGEARSAERCQAWIREHPFHSKAPARVLILSPGVACFDGEIEKDSTKALLDWLSQAGKAGVRPLLVVRSGGGDAAAGLVLMDKLQTADARVHVVDLCASSCANYFFAGAKHRSVTDGALILFHGGFSPVSRAMLLAEIEKERKSGIVPEVDWEKSESSLLRDFDHNLARQHALYERIGIKEAIVGIDSIDADAIEDSRCDSTRAAPRNFLFFTLPQLAALGILIDEGHPASEPDDVNDRLRRIGAKFEACLAPEDAFPGSTGLSERG